MSPTSSSRVQQQVCLRGAQCLFLKLERQRENVEGGERWRNEGAGEMSEGVMAKRQLKRGTKNEIREGKNTNHGHVK